VVRCFDPAMHLAGGRLQESSDKCPINLASSFKQAARRSGWHVRRHRVHTFRHTYRAWLDETGAPVGVRRNSCDIRTFLPQWTSMEMPRPWQNARPIGQSFNVS
jgi:integrase